MINESKTIGLAEAIARIGERVESIQAQAGAPPPAAPAVDAIALSVALGSGAATATSLADAATVFASAAAVSPPPADARTLQATVAGLLRDLAADTPGASRYGDPAVTRGMTAIVATLAGATAPPAPAPLSAFLVLARAALYAPSADSFATISEQLRTLLASDPTTIAPALASFSAEPAGTLAAATLPAAAISPFDPSMRALASSPARATGAAGNRAEAKRVAVLPVPERDAYGRRYSAAARQRLASLGVDPRHGFAPEAEVALAAEERWAVTFARAYATCHDYFDATGRNWDVLAPRSAAGFEPALRALAGEAGVLVYAAGISAPERADIFAAIARIGASTLYPVLAVDGMGEQPWPG